MVTLSLNRYVLAVTALLLLTPVFAYASSNNIVLKVNDGDTIVVGDISCRLYGIDAPETAKRGRAGQPYGEEAKAHLESLILNKSVTVQTTGSKTYNRDVCRIYLDKEDINLRMVQDGYAWAYVKYLKRPHASEYINAEKETRQNKRGIWKQSLPQPPWEFRRKAFKKWVL